ncbi:MAG: hypothetical protein RL657_1759, partial [Pseudomonadota bacterium]
ADRHGAKAQVHAQVAGAFDGRKVSPLAVGVNAVQKIGQQGLPARFACRNLQLGEIGGFKVNVRQARHWLAQCFGSRGQMSRIALDGVGLEVEIIHLAQPGVFVGGEDRKRRTRLGHDLLPFKHHMVLAGVQGNAVVGQPATHMAVAQLGGGFVVMAGKHGQGVQLLGQLGDFVFGQAVAHDQAATFATQLGQALAQLYQRFADELHPPIGPGQGIEDGGVEDTGHMHLAAVFQGMVERRVVVHAQIAPQPDQTTRQSGFHRSRPGAVRPATRVVAVKSEPMPADSASIDLTHHFLVAMPGLGDTLFGRSVIYVCEHNARGAMGLIINKVADLSLPQLFDKLELPLHRQDLLSQPVLQGGPVHTERGFVLHEPMRPAITEPDLTQAPEAGASLEDSEVAKGVYASTLAIPGGLEMTTSRDVLEALSNGAGPRKVLVSLGYAAWGQGQLESEIAENSWLTVAADPQVIFDTPIDQRYERALALLGLQTWMLAPDAGHA